MPQTFILTTPPKTTNDMNSAAPAPKPGRLSAVEDEYRFRVYRAEHVQLTSILAGGSDWRWQFISPRGAVLARSSGYRTEAACRASIEALQRHSDRATMTEDHQPTVTGWA